MTSARFWLPALAVLLNGLLVADVPGTAPRTGTSVPAVSEAPGARVPPTSSEPLRVSAAVAGNEFAMTMMLPGRLPDGAAPGTDRDCQGAYEWMLDRGARLVNGLRLRVRLAASRYTQVVFQSAALRVTGTPAVHVGAEPAVYFCGAAGSLPHPGDEAAPSELVGVRQDTALWFLPALAIPTEPPDPLALPSSWAEPYPFDVLAEDEASFTIDVTIPGFGEPANFVVDLRLRINGADRTFVLRDGDQPFTLLPDPGGAGFQPDRYHWCPGSPGRLEFRPAENPTGDSANC